MKKTIIGSGNYNLDTIVIRDYPEWPRLRPFTDNVFLEEVGGTCGNVMSILAWMGWDSKPLACLDDSPEGLKISEGLKSYGCDCRYVTNTPSGGTTFPKRHFLRARDEAPAFLEALADTPAVFFFDDSAAGNRLIAKGLIHFADDGKIEWTFFDVVPDGDGSAHGEERYYGRTYYHD